MTTKIGGEVTKTGGVKLRSEVGGTVGGAVTGAGGVRITSPVKAPSHIPSASDPGIAASPLAPDEFGPTEVAGPAGTITPRSRSFTNIRSTFDQPGWTFVSPQGQKFIVNEKNEVQSAGYLPGADPADQGFSPGWTTDPRLGMNPQGAWTIDKVRTLFPEMFEQKFREKYKDIDPELLSSTTTGQAGAQPQEQVTRSMIPTEADRDRFEQIVFKQNGNPFTMDPMADMRRAESEMPALFNHVFQGHAQYSDLANLSKEKRAFWEDAKQQRKREIWDLAVNRKKQALDMYTFMMAKYDRHAKELQTAGAKADKEAAAELVAAGKTPGTLEMTNDYGKLTVHQWDPTLVNPHSGAKGWWRDTGRTKHEAPLMPPGVQKAKDFVMRYSKMDPNAALFAMAASLGGEKNPALERMLVVGRAQVPADLQEIYDAELKNWFEWEKVNNPSMRAVAAAAIPAAPVRTREDAIKALVPLILANKSGAYAAWASYLEAFPTKEDHAALQDVLDAYTSVKGKPTTPAAPTATATPTPVAPLVAPPTTPQVSTTLPTPSPKATSNLGEDPFAAGTEEVSKSMQAGIEAGKAKIGEAAGKAAKATAKWLGELPTPSEYSQFKGIARINNEGTVWAPLAGVPTPILVKPALSDVEGTKRYYEALKAMGLE